MNAINVLNLQSTHRELIAGIAEAIAAAKAVRETGSDANKEQTGLLTARLREYATVTREEGADVDEARKALTGTLTMLELPTGSIKASGNHFAGFRKLLDMGEDISQKSNVDAQRAIESSEVTAIREAKKALNTYAKAKKWKAADWQAMLEREGITGEAEAEADVDAEAVEAEARAAG